MKTAGLLSGVMAIALLTFSACKKEKNKPGPEMSRRSLNEFV